MKKVKCINLRIGIKEGEIGFQVGENDVDTIFLNLKKEYEVLEENDEFYKIIDESGETYWHPKSAFAIVSEK